MDDRFPNARAQGMALPQAAELQLLQEGLPRSQNATETDKEQEQEQTKSAALFTNENWQQVTVAGAVFLIGMLLLGQQLTNLQIEVYMVMYGYSAPTAYSLWGLISYFWKADAPGLSVILAIWSGFWPVAKLLVLVLCGGT